MTRRVYKPHAFAPLVAAHFAQHPRCALWALPGIGKTVMTLTHLDALHNAWGESNPTLVLAPLQVARDTWATEAAKWEHLRGLSVTTILGKPAERKASLRRMGQVVVTNYEQLPWLVKTLKTWPFATVVADEATRLKGFRIGGSKGVRARALARHAHKDVRNWINLTGTPASNGLIDLWGQTWFLDRGQRLGTSFGAFQERWFRPVKTDYGALWKPMAHAQGEIQERVVDLCLSLDPADWFPLDKLTVMVVEIGLPRAVRLRYEEFEREMFLQLDQEQSVEVFSAGALSMKCRQFANGAIYTDDKGTWAPVHDEKIDALEHIISETGDKPLLVSYYFKSDFARLRARWPEALDLKQPQDLARARKGEGKLWLAHPASVGHGVDGLQEHCHIVVGFSQDWSLDTHSQLIDRVGPTRQYQSGHRRPVLVYELVVQGTVDEAVLDRRESKKSAEQALLDYAKRKGKNGR